MEDISTEMAGTGRYVYRRQMLVMEKGTVVQIFQPIRKLYMHKSAGTERLFTNLCQCIRQLYLFQRLAAIESLGFDRLYGGWQ